MSTRDLLIEVGVEEIPAGYLEPAWTALRERLAAALTDAALTHDRIQVWGTPRRLACGVWGLAEHQPDQVKEVTGPPASAAFDAAGNPTKAAEGFARGQGVAVTDLITLETKKGPYVAARKKIEGRPAADVLTDLVPGLILGLPFPKSMRWGQGDVVFVRPIHWLLAVWGPDTLPIAIGDIRAGRTSLGHRFMAPDSIDINGPDEYEAKLADAHVLASYQARQDAVRAEIDRALTETDGGRLIEDEELVLENANLIEKPFATTGRIEPHFLELPAKVLITAMRSHQRYFAVQDQNGRLAPYFIAINNTRARDMDVVRQGHERVLRARLDDARFYFEEDRKHPLADNRAELERVVFHSLLGTSWNKVERFSKLAEYLVEQVGPFEDQPGLGAIVARSALLCKCDLVSGVVGEFPDLQGIMGREYARLDGEPEAVAEAIAEHYMPVRAGGPLPGSPAGAVLSIADKMDTICGCFGVGMIPTGGADPYALRRQALGVINIILDRGYRLSLAELIDQALAGLTPWLTRNQADVKTDVVEFFRLRLKNQLTGHGASTDGAEAVLSVHHDDLAAARARVLALEDVKKRPDFGDLAVAFKRVVNIIKKFGVHDDFDPALVTEKPEKQLAEAVERLAAQADDLVARDRYADLMAAIVDLKPDVDHFFDHVLVDDPDPKVKANRLGLLTRLARQFERVADFSKITT